MANKKSNKEYDDLDGIQLDELKVEEETRPEERKTSIIGRAFRMISMKRAESVERLRKWSQQRNVEKGWFKMLI